MLKDLRSKEKDTPALTPAQATASAAAEATASAAAAAAAAAKAGAALARGESQQGHAAQQGLDWGSQWGHLGPPDLVKRPCLLCTPIVVCVDCLD